MKERPILFSTDMVKAILDGRKTQTRRVIKPQPFKGAWNATAEHPSHGWFWEKLYQTWEGEEDFFKRLVEFCLYGQVGDRLWVREKFALRNDGQQVMHYAGYQEIIKALDLPDFHIKWSPSIHMPRWASRITLEITDVRVERLQEIKCGGYLVRSDVQKEGCPFETDYETFGEAEAQWFINLWDSINGKMYAWESNPWVWVIEFKRYEQ